MKKMIAVLAAMVMLCCCAFASAETLLYATNPEYPPFESMDDNNQVIGYDVDLINAIGEKIGIEFQAEAMAFDAVVSSVQTNPNMIGLSGISIPSIVLSLRSSSVFLRLSPLVLSCPDVPSSGQPSLIPPKSSSDMISSLYLSVCSAAFTFCTAFSSMSAYA